MQLPGTRLVKKAEKFVKSPETIQVRIWVQQVLEEIKIDTCTLTQAPRSV